MDFLRALIEINRDVIYFGYGLVFFVLGLAIALQSRNFSRLDLARSLKWLAAFGFAHGFHEWGDLFIPIQSVYLSPIGFRWMHYFHLFLLGTSFTFLFEFGTTLLEPLGSWRWLHGVSGFLLAAWIFIVYFPLHNIFPDFNTWHNAANALARYMIGFPGGLLAAYGLRKHTYYRIVPLNVPHIVRMLRAAGVMLALYAFFGGLIAPPVPFFPGNVINSEVFERIFIAPPPVFRSLIGLGLAVAMIRALEVFDVEIARRLESMEQQQILSTERLRIARDLHDGAIQKVYTAGLLLESSQKLVDQEPLMARLGKVGDVLNDAIQDLRRNLDELHEKPKPVTLERALHEIIEEPRYRTLVDIDLDLALPEDLNIPALQSEHILAIVNEALSNAVRHANARHVAIRGFMENSSLKVVVKDDGLGMPVDYKPGYGLRNMRDRSRLLGGELKIEPAQSRGTRIELTIPLHEVS
jgi:signal transduction histidine kinase